MNKIIFIENLKLYNPLKNRGLLFLYVIALDVLFVGYSLSNTVPSDPGHIYSVRPLLFFFLSMYLFGTAAVQPQLELMIKPQFLCLPGSQKTMKRILTITGCFAILFSILVLMPYSRTAADIWIIKIITAPVLGLPFFLLAVCLSLFIRVDKPNSIIIKSGLHLIVLLIIAVGFFIGNFSLSFKSLTFFWVLPFSISSIALVAALTRILGEFDIVRKYHTGLFIPGLAATLNKDNQLAVIKQKPEKQKTEKNFAERYFLKIMEKCPFLSLSRSLSGSIYKMIERKIDFESMLKQSFLRKILLSTLFLLITGYFPMENSIFFMVQLFCLFAPIMVSNSIFHISFNELLLPGGRSEGFTVNTFIVFIIKIISTSYVAFIIALSWLLHNIMPGISLPWFDCTYTPLAPELLIWAVLFISIINFFSFYRASGRGKKSLLRVYALMMLFILILGYFEFAILSGNLQMWMVVCAFLLITGLDLFQHIHYWFKQDLV